MKKIGTKSLGAMGRIVIPELARKTLRVRVGGKLDLYLEGENLIIRKHKPDCAVCGSTTDVVHTGRANLCGPCRKAAVEIEANLYARDCRRVHDELFGEVESDARK